MIRPPSTLVFEWSDSARSLYPDATVDLPILSVARPAADLYDFSPHGRMFRLTSDGPLWEPLTLDDCDARTQGTCTVPILSDDAIRYAFWRSLTTHAREERVRQGVN